MKPYIANIINSTVLIVVGLWGYFALSSGGAEVSPTALIPVGFGALFLGMTPGVKSENKIIAHVVVLFTLLLIIALMKPLTGAIGREDTLGMIRIVGMMLSCSFALVMYIRNFIENRKAKKMKEAIS